MKKKKDSLKKKNLKVASISNLLSIFKVSYINIFYKEN